MTNDRLHEILKILRLELAMIDKTIRTLEAMLESDAPARKEPTSSRPGRKPRPSKRGGRR